MAALPDYLPESVARNFDKWMKWTLGGLPEQQACFLRLIERPCMEKVWRTLDRVLTNETAWERVLERATFYADYQDEIDHRYKPAQKEVRRKLAQVQKAGEDLIAALDWLWEEAREDHGYYRPDDWGDLLHVLKAGRMGEKGKRLGDLLYDRPLFPAEAPFGEYPKQLRMTLGRYTVQHVIRAVVDMHSEWKPGSTGGECEEAEWSQKTGDSVRAQTFVRLIARDLKESCENQPTIFPSLDSLPHGRLLSYDNLARLTRAALDLPDEPPGFPHRKPFDAEDVRKALKGHPG